MSLNTDRLNKDATDVRPVNWESAVDRAVAEVDRERTALERWHRRIAPHVRELESPLRAMLGDRRARGIMLSGGVALLRDGRFYLAYSVPFEGHDATRGWELREIALPDVLARTTFHAIRLAFAQVVEARVKARERAIQRLRRLLA